MTKQDRIEFRLYLEGCTDAQVEDVYEKELAAHRAGYAELARDEAHKRKMNIDHWKDLK